MKVFPLSLLLAMQMIGHFCTLSQGREETLEAQLVYHLIAGIDNDNTRLQTSI